MTKLQIQEIYQSKLTHLSIKARFILSMLKLEGFDDFYHSFIEQRQKINFSQLKNCGFQTQQELDELIKIITKLSIDIQMEADFQTPNFVQMIVAQYYIQKEIELQPEDDQYDPLLLLRKHFFRLQIELRSDLEISYFENNPVQ